MKILRFILILILLFSNCISMMETAKIRKGMNYGFSAEYSRVFPKNKNRLVETQLPHIFGADFKMAHGWFLNPKYGVELGLSAGLFYYPSVIGEISYDESNNRYSVNYYPYKAGYNYTSKFFTKFGIMQDKPVSFAARLEIIPLKFSSAAVIASKKTKKNEYYAGLKIFNRFLKNPEKKIYNDGSGEYLFFGVKKQIKKRSFIDIISYNYLFMEFGFINNVWYNSKPTICLSVGVTSK